MNHNHIPTEQEEQVAAEANAIFAEQMKHFKNACGALQDIESNLTIIGNEAFKTALLSPGRTIKSTRSVPPSSLATVSRLASCQPASCNSTAKSGCVNPS
jgi:hypothetical protein